MVLVALVVLWNRKVQVIRALQPVHLVQLARKVLEVRQGQADRLDLYHHPVPLAPEGLMDRAGLHYQTDQMGLHLLLAQVGLQLLFLQQFLYCPEGPWSPVVLVVQHHLGNPDLQQDQAGLLNLQDQQDLVAQQALLAPYRRECPEFQRHQTDHGHRRVPEAQLVLADRLNLVFPVDREDLQVQQIPEVLQLHGRQTDLGVPAALPTQIGLLLPEVLGPQQVLEIQGYQQFLGRPKVLVDPKVRTVQYYHWLQGLPTDQEIHWLLRVRVARLVPRDLLVQMVLIDQMVLDLHLVLAVLSLHFDLRFQDYHLVQWDRWLQMDLLVQKDLLDQDYLCHLMGLSARLVQLALTGQGDPPVLEIQYLLQLQPDQLVRMDQPVQLLQPVPVVQLNLGDLVVLGLQMLLRHLMHLVAQLVPKVLWVPGCPETQLDPKDPEDQYCRRTQYDLQFQVSQRFQAILSDQLVQSDLLVLFLRPVPVNRMVLGTQCHLRVLEVQVVQEFLDLQVIQHYQLVLVDHDLLQVPGIQEDPGFLPILVFLLVLNHLCRLQVLVAPCLQESHLGQSAPRVQHHQPDLEVQAAQWNQVARDFPGFQKVPSDPRVQRDPTVPLVQHLHVVQPVPVVLLPRYHQQVQPTPQDLGHLLGRMVQAGPASLAVQADRCCPCLLVRQMLPMVQVNQLVQAIQSDQLVLEYLCHLVIQRFQQDPCLRLLQWIRLLPGVLLVQMDQPHLDFQFLQVAPPIQVNRKTPEDQQVQSDHDLQPVPEVQRNLVVQRLLVVLCHLSVQVVQQALENPLLLQALVDRPVPLNPEVQMNLEPRLAPPNPQHPSVLVLLCRQKDQLVQQDQDHLADQDFLSLREYQVHQWVRMVQVVQQDQPSQLGLWVLCRLTVPQAQ